MAPNSCVFAQIRTFRDDIGQRAYYTFLAPSARNKTRGKGIGWREMGGGRNPIRKKTQPPIPDQEHP
jgi:hypothetical protein